MKRIFLLIALAPLMAAPRAQQPTQTTQQPTELVVPLAGEGGAPPRLAVPEFIAVTKDTESVAIAKTISQVLFDDLTFEREFALIPRDVYAMDLASGDHAGVMFNVFDTVTRR